MNKVPYHWIIVDRLYSLLGRFGYLIGSTKLVDAAIARMDRQIQRANDRL